MELKSNSSSTEELGNLAIMLGDKNNNYTESESSTFPSNEKYSFNPIKSGCIDASGNAISDKINYSSGVATIETDVSSYCYLYFDYVLLTDCNGTIGECLMDNPTLGLNTTMEGGLYRYQGEAGNVNNYVCFGTTSKEECLSDTDKYMYRVIGIDENNQVKLIKKEALNTAYQWHSSNVDITWPDSDLYKGLNGSYYLETDYVPNGWGEKIATVSWKYGDNTVNNTSAANLYTIENGWTTKSDAKIGLWYLHDYYHGMSEENNCSSYSTCKTSWVYLWNNENDSSVPHEYYEWTMSRYGYDSNHNIYRAWYVHSNGANTWHSLSATAAVRPTFYLTSNTQYKSGTGTIENPIILKQTISDYILGSSENGLQKTIIEGDELYRFAGLNGNEGIKNYICLGTDSCSSGSDNMYRIIGVNPTNGELKVVKETPWNNSQTYTWHNTDEEITWDKSDLYNNTVKLIYDNLAFKNIIVLNHVWGIGAMNVEDVATRKGILSLENASTMLANVNILSVADYYLAYNADRNWRTSYDTTTNWIDMHQNILSPTNDEWTMSFYGYWENTFPSYKSWAIDYIYGGISRYGGDSKGNIRPTFYIQPIEYISGDGSKENPFIVE